MGGEQDEVLSLEDTDKSFSGFSSLDSEDEVPERRTCGNKKGGRVKSVVVKPSTSSVKHVAKKGRPRENSKRDQPSDVVRGKKPVKSKDDKNILDISKLSERDLSSLREALGITPQTVEVTHEEESDVFGSLENLPGVRVEIDSRDISDGEIVDNVPRNMGVDMSNALFDDADGENVEESVWNLPKLKAPQKGDPIGQSLANMINMACTSQCEVDNFVAKYKVPRNCDRACPPLVNGEIWKIMDKRSQTADRSIADIQNMVTTGITPIIKLADVLKKEISNNGEAKSLLSDALVILGQVQYLLSVKRRYMIRPTLKKKYQGLCNISMPITTQLFGDDVAKDIKSCDSMSSIGREQRFFGTRGGRGNPRFARRQFGAPSNYGGNSSGHRFHPYPQRGQGRFPGRNMGYRIPKKAATATSTAPNPNDQ